MQSWSAPYVPALDECGEAPRVYDTKRGELVELRGTGGEVSMYSCGITPYDATHLGHAFTYLAADTLTRVWRDAGLTVRTAMNSTDIDDPLLERATRDGVDWRELAAEQQELFRTDMEVLRILPPDHWVAVTDEIARIAKAVETLLSNGAAYRVASDDSIADGELGDDIYFDSSIDRGWPLGTASRTDEATMLAEFAERGGDPERPGKRNPLDALLWRAARDGEPSWEAAIGRGRPGWHIECTVIAMHRLGAPCTAAFGGADLRFPHQEFQGQHALALGASLFSEVRLNAGVVAYRGEKMSKSLGNLVKVSDLRADGVRPAALRLALLNHHWRDDWEWRDSELDAANMRLDHWLAWAAAGNDDPSIDEDITQWLRITLHDDLNTPAALQAVDALVARAPVSDASLAAIDALLGIDLRA